MHTDRSEAERPILTVLGGSVALGPLRRDLVPLFQRWANDPEVNRTLDGHRPETFEAALDRFERESRDDGSVHFVIYERATSRPIGVASLGAIDHRHHRAVFSIVIGESDCWRKGYGTETTRLVLDFGFSVLGLHSVRLGVHGFNERGIRAYEKAGFRRVGVLREYHHFDGHAHDVILMDCLATDVRPAERS